MSRLIFVRHGQASFFSDDYDKLSPLGEEQARVLADYWLARGTQIDQAYCGTLKRQRRTAEIVAESYAAAGVPWPELTVLPGLDEYPADEIMGTLVPELIEREDRFRQLQDEADNAVDDKARYRTFHRLLEAVMAEWINGTYESNGIMTWTEFRDGVRDSIRQMTRTEERGVTVAVFSSGGPIGISVQTVLQAPDLKAGELNWRINNCSLTEFTFSGDRIALDTFNAVPHITDPKLFTYR